MKEVYVEPGQDMFDICMQEYGGLTNFVYLHELNGLTEIPATLAPGQKMFVDGEIENAAIANIFSKKKPANYNEKMIEAITLGGIDNMGIQIDFIVS